MTKPALDMNAREYADAKRALVTDAARQQQRALDLAAERRRLQQLADSGADLVQLRDDTVRRGASMTDAIRFYRRINWLREEAAQ